MLLVHQSRGLRRIYADVVKKVRPQTEEYLCLSEERTVVCRAVLTWAEMRAPQTAQTSTPQRELEAGLLM